MKKFLFFVLVALLFSIAAVAQGVSKLFGLVGGYPQANQSTNGFLFRADSSGNNVQLQYDFPVTVSGGLPGNLELVPYNGKLYGTTTQGGIYNYGTIFEYDPVTNSYTKKYDFGSSLTATGGTPKGSLLLYNGKFYGLAGEYGANFLGNLFEWDPATNIFTKKFDFTGTGGGYPGSYPQNSLRLYNGKMYGTTQQGGTNNQGVVFEWDPSSNVYKDMYDGNVTTGREFYNNVTVYNNKLYGMSYYGGVNNQGVLFVIDPALANGVNYTVLKEFSYTADGANASNNEMIVYNNKLYGCLNQGGTGNRGTLFEFNPATTGFTKLVDFDYYITGGNPQGKLVANGTKFLGLCSQGNVANGTGTVFEWDPANPTTVVKKIEFGPNNFDNIINPGSTFVLFNSKFYAVSYNGGFVNRGTLFEYDYALNTVTKKLNFDAAETGRVPYGKPTLLNGKLYGTCYYGPQEIFGSPYGCIWSFDPSSSTYSRKIIFDNVNNSINGRGPVSSPVAYNGKLYGVTQNGGVSDLGVLYEYDAVSNVYTKKDMQPIGGQYPSAEPVVFNSKLYGTTTAGGNGNNGIIYCYDPATGILSKVYDLNTLGSYSSNAGLVVYNNKLYGTTLSGGANNAGAIFSFDPATNTGTSLYDLTTANGQSVYNAMTVYNNKMYNTALGGGANGRGTIFQFDPATNGLNLLHSFISGGPTGYDPHGGLTVSGNKLYCITNDGSSIIDLLELDPATNIVTTKSAYTVAVNNQPVMHNGLTVVPAFIANGTPGSCETYPTVVINGSNNNQWVPILNAAGDVVAEIKANGNNLGNVNASSYINNTTVREDPIKRLYMDRNLTITVQNQPSSNVDIRLYVKTAEFLALKNATNSLGQPSGISTINDVAIFKNEQSCSGTLTQNAARITTVTNAYEYGYVLTASINSFSTFFFAKNTFTALPLTIINFDAVKQEQSVKLNWVTENEINVASFEVEKSSNASDFTATATVAAKGNIAPNNYSINDNHPFAGVNYYRLKAVDKNNQFKYSGIVKVDFSKRYTISILPNPAKDFITINGADAFKQIQVIDVTGTVVKQMNKEATNRYNISGLNKGVYFIKLINQQETVTSKIVIE
jgi:uncharacterized repeat protein (TIGR03803 family)